jgi:hypothetical protein
VQEHDASRSFTELRAWDLVAKASAWGNDLTGVLGIHKYLSLAPLVMCHMIPYSRIFMRL